MRTTLILCTLALALAGCVTAGQIDANIKAVQEATRKGCSYVATVETVAKIFASGSGFATAASVAAAICTAVTTAPLADGPGDRIPRVNGVVIKGRYVR